MSKASASVALLFTVGLLAASLALSGLSPSGKAGAAPAPAMSLSGPNSLIPGTSVTLTVRADPAPITPIAGFSSEIIVPEGLSLAASGTCGGDVLVDRVDAQPLQICVRSSLSAPGPIRHVVGSAVAATPLPPLDIPSSGTADLLKLDVTCDTEGAYDVVLSAEPHSPWGAIYFETNTSWIPVATTQHNGEPVADVHRIYCITPDDDLDGDGCRDGPEVASGRNPFYVWDFFDTPPVAHAILQTVIPDPVTLPFDITVSSTNGFSPALPYSFLDIEDDLFAYSVQSATTFRLLNRHPSAVVASHAASADVLLAGRRDGAIAGTDFFRLLSRFGATQQPPPTIEEAEAEVLQAPPPAPQYHVAFDRTSVPGSYTGPPDGAVSGTDLFSILAQFGADCPPLF